jgi:DNA helicase II / ATP-dependent DNA helicase PcrA
VTELSEEQLAACQDLAGPARVVAGAGTGKTTVIAERVRRLVTSGVDPGAILVMTFTERAASQMRERIAAATDAEPPNVGTFHSLALRWLREYPSGLPSHFRILTGAERWIFLRELMWELGHPALVGTERPDDLVHPLLKLMERLKQELVPVPRLAEWARRQEDPERRDMYVAAAQLLGAHAQRCRREALADFDDLLLRAVRMLEEREDVASGLRDRFPWVMVDEYQDCNASQERLVELLGAPGGNVCVVGDDDQSIYRFRGASRASMERFVARFRDARTMALGANRRSVARIVDSARTLIEHSQNRLPKPLRPVDGAAAGAPVQVWRCPDGESETRAMVRAISQYASSGVPLDEIAVLSRTHAIARPLLEALDAAGIPAHHWSAQGFFRRPEIRDLIAYLKLVHDPADVLALARLVTRPPLRLDLAAVLEAARGQGAVEDGPVDPLLRLQRWGPTSDWAERVLDLIPLKARLGVDHLLFEILERTRHLEAIVPAAGAERQRVLANVERFSEVVSQYCERRSDHSLALFVDHIELVLRSGIDEQEPAVEGLDEAVQVMSIHQAKGLEFEVVLIPALVEGRLPQPHRSDGLELPGELVEPLARGRADHLAEERRLLYVAMTRARRHLVLSWAERYEGSRRWRPSRFLSELGEDLETIEQPAVAPASHAPVAEAVPAPDAPAPTLSFSAISTHRECPRQYWYRYRLRLPPLPAVEAQLGTVVHEALLQAGRIRQEGGDLDETLLRDIYDDAWEGVVLAEPRRRPVIEDLGWRLLRGFWCSGGLDDAPHLLERAFSAELDGWRLRGIIDRVDRVGDAWRIIDYKTGRPLPASRLRRDLQLALYALGAGELGLDPLELEIAYLRDGKRVQVDAGPDLIADAKRIGSDVARSVRSGNFIPRPERRRCALCSYRLTCDAAL